MVDEKKTILMTKLAIFEKHEKNKSLVVSKYYRSDYVRYNVLKTWVAVTVLYWCLIAGYVFMAFDSILEKLNDLDYFAIVYKMLGGYVIVCAIYFVIASLIHADDPLPVRQMVAEGTRTTDDVSAARANSNPAAAARAHVNRSDLVNRQLQAQQERKNQEIIENVRKRNERIQAQQEIEAKRQQEIEAERQRIRQRREQLEQEQLRKLREEQNRKMYREDHVYNTNKPDKTGRGE